MTRLTEAEFDDQMQVHVFPCHCGDGAMVKVVWADDDPSFRYLELQHHFEPGLKHRLKVAWKILRRGRAQWAEIILNPQSVRGLHDFLGSRLP